MKPMTLEDHARAWWIARGKKLPRRNTKAYARMYAAWVEYAFGGLGR